MEYRQLGKTDIKVSHLSFGSSSLGSVFRDTDDRESIQVVHQALNSGINYFDSAPWYGHGKAETVLGKALVGIPREKYCLATKVGRYRPEIDQMFDFSAERTLRSVDESLARLGVDYVDIIQVHDMEFAPSLDIIINQTLPALQKVKDSGKARYIGITGYPLENFRTVLEKSQVHIDAILTYCRYSMNDSSLLDYIPYLQDKGVGIINASPISMGLLTSRGPPKWHPAQTEIRDVCRQAADHCQEQGVDISRLALHYSLDNPDIHTTLFSTASLSNLQRNFDVLENPVTDHETSVMKEVMTRYMKPLNNRNWESEEVKNYWQQLRHKGTGKVPG